MQLKGLRPSQARAPEALQNAMVHAGTQQGMDQTGTDAVPVPALDQLALALTFSLLPYNSIKLSVQSLSKYWRDWAVQHLSSSTDPPSKPGWVPLWALKQQGVHLLTDEQQDELMEEAARAGDLPALQWLYEQLGRGPWFGTARSLGVTFVAAAAGSLDILQWARDHGFIAPDEAYEGAAHVGQLDVLEWLHEAGYPCENDTVYLAAAGCGQLGSLQWAIGKGYPWTKNVFVYAAQYGMVEVLEWVKQQGLEMDISSASMVAIHQGRLGALKWLKDAGPCWDVQEYMEMAVDFGELEIVQWVWEQGFSCDAATCTRAAWKGHLEVLQWLREKGCPWDASTASGAAHGGQLEVLRWALANGCAGGEHICTAAALGGQLEVLQWAVEEGYPWGNTCLFAVKGGYIELLRWAREHGCPWDREVCMAAAAEVGLDISDI